MAVEALREYIDFQVQGWADTILDRSPQYQLQLTDLAEEHRVIVEEIFRTFINCAMPKFEDAYHNPGSQIRIGRTLNEVNQKLVVACDAIERDLRLSDKTLHPLILKSQLSNRLKKLVKVTLPEILDFYPSFSGPDPSPTRAVGAAAMPRP